MDGSVPESFVKVITAQMFSCEALSLADAAVIDEERRLPEFQGYERSAEC